MAFGRSYAMQYEETQECFFCPFPFRSLLPLLTLPSFKFPYPPFPSLPFLLLTLVDASHSIDADHPIECDNGFWENRDPKKAEDVVFPHKTKKLLAYRDQGWVDRFDSGASYCAGTQIVFFDQSALVYRSYYEVQMTIHRPAVHTDDTGGGADEPTVLGDLHQRCAFVQSCCRYVEAAEESHACSGSHFLGIHVRRDSALECLEREVHRVTSAYEQCYHGGARVYGFVADCDYLLLEITDLI
ncbi:hypothetical protein DFH08DRAFT_828092 [Mycena albidolilacea]|uniref:Uncharacterized protein n=1 Tax=Mycena albidolilacea TaxID=1033008 RepID=A0AAD6YWR0_9AGAR|nr:hypothetical protein DFH08DRAFT_828092 [Mycena albidolilacea]